MKIARMPSHLDGNPPLPLSLAFVPICTNVQTKWYCQQKSLLRSRSRISHWTAFEGRNVLQIDILKDHPCNTDANALARPPYPDDCRPDTAQPLSGWLRHDQREDVRSD